MSSTDPDLRKEIVVLQSLLKEAALSPKGATAAAAAQSWMEAEIIQAAKRKFPSCLGPGGPEMLFGKMKASGLLLASSGQNGWSVGLDKMKALSRHSRVALDPNVLKFTMSTANAGLDNGLVLETIDKEKPGLVAFFGSVRDAPAELADYDYQLHQLPSGGATVYVHRDYSATFIEDLSSGGNGGDASSLWLKMSHGDAGSLRPTLVGLLRWRRASGIDFVPSVRRAMAASSKRYGHAEVLLMGAVASRSSAEQLKSLDLKVKTFDEEEEEDGAGFAFVARTSFFLKGAASLDGVGRFLTFVQSRHFCLFCKASCPSHQELVRHRGTQKHRLNYCAGVYCSNREALVAVKEDLDVEVVEPRAADLTTYDKADGLITFKAEKGKPAKLVLKVANSGAARDGPKGDGVRKLGLIVTSIEFLLSDPDVALWDKFGFTKPLNERPENVKQGIRVLSGQGFDVTVRVTKPSLGQTKLILLLAYKSEITGSSHVLAREVLVKVTNQEVASLKPTAPYARAKKKARFFAAADGNLVKGLPFAFSYSHGRDDVLRSVGKRLEPFKPDPDLEALFARGLSQFAGMTTTQRRKLNAVLSILESGAAPDHCARLRLLLEAEEHQVKREVRTYDLEEVEMRKGNNGGLFEVQVPGLSENRPSVIRGDKIVVKLSRDDGAAAGQRQYEGTVHDVRETSIFVGFAVGVAFLPGCKFDVRFTVNRFTYKIMYHALKKIERQPASLQLVRAEGGGGEEPTGPPAEIRSYFNRRIEGNEEQKDAVKNILAGGIPGVPYIVFGPPGTGKTVTVVEAIHQVWRHKEGSRIIAVAPSNSAADLLAERILRNVPASQVLRYLAPSRDESRLRDVVKGVSNFDANHSVASVADLRKYRVVVMTLVTSGRLSLLSPELPPDHFTHVFVDEAGYATEPETFVPLACCTQAGAQLVLTGDPKQLGPILRSPIAARRNGLATSMMERLMAASDRFAKPYDVRTITKLLKNFRSHEALLALPSRLFYDGELECAADEVLTRSLEDSEVLPARGFPFVFHGVIGGDLREGNSPSFFNREEAVTIVDYVQRLLDGRPSVTAAEIGIISPYRKQVEKIKNLMNQRHQKDASALRNWKNVSVGSTEQFQGQERRVILITTVRSEPDYLKSDFQFKLGFLKNPKRFNVAVTRAKALMVVVGNPKLLCLDPCWKELVRYAKDNGAYKGVGFELPSAEEEASGGFGGAVPDVELLEIEKKFADMGLSGGGRVNEDNDDDDTSSFEEVSSVRASSATSFDVLEELHDDLPDVRLEQ